MTKDLLSHHDQSFLKQVQHFFDDLQVGMSAFQIRNFVLNDEAFPLPDSKYHQAKLELYTRWQKVVELDFADRKKRAQIKLLQAQQEKWKSNLTSEHLHERLAAEAQIEMLDIDIEQSKSARLFLRKSCEEALREMRIFREVVDEMAVDLGYANREEAEPAHWGRVLAIREQQANASSAAFPESHHGPSQTARAR